MVDVDHFKLFNDHYGHPAGDVVLRSVAGALSSVCQRPADLVARVGGEEFAVILPDTSAAGAIHLASSLCAAISALNIPHASSPTAAHITVSAGVATYTPAALEPSAEPQEGSGQHTRPPLHTDLIAAADAALYDAKRAGRARARMVDLEDHFAREPSMGSHQAALR